MSKKVGVVVVHGIGDPNPGEALRELTVALTSANIIRLNPNSPEIKQHWIPLEHKRASGPASRLLNLPLQMGQLEEKNQTDDKQTGSKQTNAEKTEVVFAEVFWGAASKLSGGWIGVIMGISQLFAGMQTIIAAASPNFNQRKNLKSWQGVYYLLAYTVSILLSGPVLAINILLGIALILQLALAAQPYTPWLVMILSCLLAGTLFKILPVLQSAQIKALRVSIFGCILLWFGVALARQHLSKQLLSSEEISFSILLPLGIFFVLATVLLLVVLLAFSTVSLFRPKAITPSLKIAATVASLQFGLWVTASIAIWGGLKILFDSDSKTRFIWEIYDKYIRVVPAGADTSYQWNALVNAITFVTLLTLLSIFVVVIFRALWQRKNAHTNRRAPRLILSDIIGYTLIATILPAILFTNLSRIAEPNIAFPQSISFIKIANVLKDNALVPLLIPPFLGLLSQPIRAILDLANDVVLYLFRESKNDLSIRQTFRKTVDYLVSKQDIERLIVIAHSQGTVIAADELADPALEPLFQNLPVTLVTMGSPLSHLYQHYFPSQYPSWQAAHWDKLFERVSTWINLYRRDDYVGTQITCPKRSDVNFKNHALGLGGHLGYWRDDAAIAALLHYNVFSTNEADEAIVP
ncbi:MAG: hypothetical protein AAFN38_08520 [Cyanobacteria bacterium J06560_5]